MRIMHDAEGIMDSRYSAIRDLVARHVSGETGVAHVKDAYDQLFSGFAWPGGYTVIFTTDAGDVLCGSCARKAFIMEQIDVTAGCYDEGPAMQCDECGKEMESSYGEVEE